MKVPLIVNDFLSRAAALFIGFWGPASIGTPVAGLLLVFALLVAADGFGPVFRDPPPNAPGLGRLLAISGAMALAVSINPLGFEIYAFPFEFTAEVNTITRNVPEWRPLLDAAGATYQSLTFSSYVVFSTLWCFALALVVWRGTLGRLEFGLFIAIALLPFRHQRWMATVCLVATPALACALTHAVAHTRSRSTVRTWVSLFLVVLGLAVLSAALVVLSAGSVAELTRPPDFALLAVLALSVACGICALLAAVAPGGWLAREGGSWFAAVGAAALCMLAVTNGIPTRPHQAGPPPALTGFGPVGWVGRAAPAVEYLRRHEIPG